MASFRSRAGFRAFAPSFHTASKLVQLKGLAPCLRASSSPPALPGICRCWACSPSSCRTKIHHPAAATVWKMPMAMECWATRRGPGCSPAHRLPGGPWPVCGGQLLPCRCGRVGCYEGMFPLPAFLPGQLEVIKARSCFPAS